MSSMEYVCYGYGFSLENATNFELIKEILINNYKEGLTDDECSPVVNKIQQFKPDNMWELIDLIESQLMSDTVSSTIANWMNYHEEYNPKHIRFEGYGADADCGTEETVMFSVAYPWNYKEEEKYLTQDELNQILSLFAKELGINEEEIDYQELHYYG